MKQKWAKRHGMGTKETRGKIQGPNKLTKNLKTSLEENQELRSKMEEKFKLDQVKDRTFIYISQMKIMKNKEMKGTTAGLQADDYMRKVKSMVEQHYEHDWASLWGINW